MPAQPVKVTLQQLEQGLEFSTLEHAFGEDSLGIILVAGLPARFRDLRMKVLRSISEVAQLPCEETEKLENAESTWLTGWSRGKEILSATGEPDFNKGSYYVNCAFHKDATLEGPPASLAAKFPSAKAYTCPNIWPHKGLPRLEGFEPDCKELCSLIIDVAAQVARNCDSYISATNRKYEAGFLQRIVGQSTCTKARLLHYYPLEIEEKSEESEGNDDSGEREDNRAQVSDAKDTWCGEHTDHSCLTGLTSALYIDENTGEAVQDPDPEAGLYIRSRQGETVKVSIPADCLAFQSGSALQEISKTFRAVSHYVRGASVPRVARNTLAVFCQPDLDEMVNERENFAAFAARILQENHKA